MIIKKSNIYLNSVSNSFVSIMTAKKGERTVVRIQMTGQCFGKV